MAILVPQLRVPNQKPLLGALPNLAHPASKGLTCEWVFNERGGNKVYDGSGNGKTGTFAGDPQWVAGFNGPAIEFDGTGDYILIGDKPDLELQDFTLFARAKLDVLGEYNALFGLQVDGATGGAGGTGTLAGALLRTNSDNTVSFIVVVANAIEIITTTDTVDTGWHHYAAVKNGTFVAIYIDGSVRKTGTLSSATVDYSSDESTPTTIGTYFGSGVDLPIVNFNGQIDMSAIRNRAL